MKLQVLIVEDELSIRTGLSDVFVFHGYDVKAVEDGEQGLREALSGNYDLIILDIMLPKRDGFSVCNEIRAVSREQPIIMLTAKGTEEDVVAGLTLGADDYITKPFSIHELVLRAQAVLRRSRKAQRVEALLTVGNISIDTRTLQASAAGGQSPLLFTRREVEILQYLLQNAERPVSRGELLEQVWDYRKAAALDTRTVDIHITKLRRKIEPDPKEPRYIITVRGEGYQLIGARQGAM